MTAAEIRAVEAEGAEALLDTGLSVPLKSLRLPFGKSITLRVVMRRPTFGGQIRIAKEWLKMGVTSAEMWKMDHEAQMKFLVEHGKSVSRMIAMMICRGWLSRHLLIRPTSWFVRNMMSHEYLIDVVKKFVSLIGTDPFISIIRLAESVNPMPLRLSQDGKAS